MAWRVMIADRDTLADSTSWKLRLLCRYYDDSDPANTPTPTNFLWVKEFLFDGSTLTLQVVQDAVFAEGAKQRQAYSNAQQGISIPQLSIGTTYPVP